MTKKKWIVIGACLVLILLVLGGLSGAMALFTDTETVEASVIATGSLDISIHGAHWQNDVSEVNPGGSIVFEFTLQSDGSLPLVYIVDPKLSGVLAGGEYPCDVIEVKIDDETAFLSAAGGSDTTDTIEVTVAMPSDAGSSEYEGKGGTLIVTIHATQQ